MSMTLLVLSPSSVFEFSSVVNLTNDKGLIGLHEVLVPGILLRPPTCLPIPPSLGLRLARPAAVTLRDPRT